jgi:hypothetical protein
MATWNTDSNQDFSIGFTLSEGICRCDAVNMYFAAISKYYIRFVARLCWWIQNTLTFLHYSYLQSSTCQYTNVFWIFTLSSEILTPHVINYNIKGQILEHMLPYNSNELLFPLRKRLAQFWSHWFYLEGSRFESRTGYLLYGLRIFVLFLGRSRQMLGL